MPGLVGSKSGRVDTVKIARVFARKTSFSPTGPDCYFDRPGLFTPVYDEAHISCVFTWDKERAQELARTWGGYASIIRVGGPAFNSPADEFIPGKYLKQGVVITSRGCPNNCSFCLVPKREGSLREVAVKPGNIIQDNNILACSSRHLDKVFSMLQGQKQIEFKGGLEASRITPVIADRLRGLSIKTLWLACDHRSAVKGFKRAVGILQRAGFTQSHICCYVLIGDDRQENEERLRTVYESGARPFAQLYQPEIRYIEYSQEWKRFARTWSRPAAYTALMNGRVETRGGDKYGQQRLTQEAEQ